MTPHWTTAWVLEVDAVGNLVWVKEFISEIQGGIFGSKLAVLPAPDGEILLNASAPNLAALSKVAVFHLEANGNLPGLVTDVSPPWTDTTFVPQPQP